MASYNKGEMPEALATRDGFSTFADILVTEAIEGGAQGELTIMRHSLNPLGIVHGGCLATLADTVAGVAVYVATGSMCVTVNYTLNFLRPALGTGEKIYCRAMPEKLGRTLCVYRVSLTDDGGGEVAVGTFTFFRKDSKEV